MGKKLKLSGITARLKAMIAKRQLPRERDDPLFSSMQDIVSRRHPPKRTVVRFSKLFQGVGGEKQPNLRDVMPSEGRKRKIMDEIPKLSADSERVPNMVHEERLVEPAKLRPAR
jgi:hypothetical protein